MTFVDIGHVRPATKTHAAAAAAVQSLVVGAMLASTPLNAVNVEI